MARSIIFIDFIDGQRVCRMGAALVRKTYWAYAIILCCLGSPAQAAGIQLFDSGPGLTGAIWYPCTAESQRVPLGSLAVPFSDSLQSAAGVSVSIEMNGRQTVSSQSANLRSFQLRRWQCAS
jgi:hypothetical protein